MNSKEKLLQTTKTIYARIKYQTQTQYPKEWLGAGRAKTRRGKDLWINHLPEGGPVYVLGRIAEDGFPAVGEKGDITLCDGESGLIRINDDVLIKLETFQCVAPKRPATETEINEALKIATDWMHDVKHLRFNEYNQHYNGAHVRKTLKALTPKKPVTLSKHTKRNKRFSKAQIQTAINTERQAKRNIGR